MTPSNSQPPWKPGTRNSCPLPSPDLAPGKKAEPNRTQRSSRADSKAPTHAPPRQRPRAPDRDDLGYGLRKSGCGFLPDLAARPGRRIRWHKYFSPTASQKIAAPMRPRPGALAKSDDPSQGSQNRSRQSPNGNSGYSPSLDPQAPWKRSKSQAPLAKRPRWEARYYSRIDKAVIVAGADQ